MEIGNQYDAYELPISKPKYTNSHSIIKITINLKTILSSY